MSRSTGVIDKQRLNKVSKVFQRILDMDQSGVPMGLKVVKSRDLRDFIEGYDAMVVMTDMLMEREVRLNNRIHTLENKLREAQGADPKDYERLQPIEKKEAYKTRLAKRRKKRSEKERLLQVRRVEY